MTICLRLSTVASWWEGSELTKVILLRLDCPEQSGPLNSKCPTTSTDWDALRFPKGKTSSAFLKMTEVPFVLLLSEKILE